MIIDANFSEKRVELQADFGVVYDVLDRDPIIVEPPSAEEVSF